MDVVHFGIKKFNTISFISPRMMDSSTLGDRAPFTAYTKVRKCSKGELEFPVFGWESQTTMSKHKTDLNPMPGKHQYTSHAMPQKLQCPKIYLGFEQLQLLSVSIIEERELVYMFIFISSSIHCLYFPICFVSSFTYCLYFHIL